MANIKQVAALAGLSVSCVSKYLKKPDSVLPVSREKIESAIAELHYVPSSVARNLRTKRTGIIKIISHSIRNPFCAELFELLRKNLEDNGYIAILQLVEASGPVDLKKKDLEQVDGIILSCVENEEIFTDLRDILPPDYPIVCIHNSKPPIDIAAVIMDLRNGMRTAANYLISIGCTNLAFVGGPVHSSIGVLKFSGISDAIASAQENVSIAGIIHKQVDWESGYSAAHELLSYTNVPDGIICESDMVAAGVIQGLVKNHVHIPQQTHIIGCDNTIIAEAVFPQLTSIGVPTGDVCEIACQKLLALISDSGDRTFAAEDVLFTPELIVRSSC